MSDFSEIKVRSACEKDTAAVLAFFRQASKEVQEGMKCLPNGSKGIYPSEQMILDCMKENRVYIALGSYDKDALRTDDGWIVGGMLSNHECNEGFRQAAWQVEAEDQNIAYWHSLRVLKDCQGRGIARKVLNEAIRTEKERGMTVIRFDTVIGNDNAIHLYESMGFKTIGIYPVYEEDIGQHESIMYEMILKQADCK